nr:TonB-dependent receptor [Sphingomonas colocasiae]
MAAPAHAQSGAQRNFNIEAQNLDRALAIFGSQSGLQVTVDGAQVRGVRTQGVSGAMSPEQALSTLLSGTGFTFRHAGANTVLIERAPTVADGATQLGPVRVEGAGASAGLAPSANSDMLASEATRSYTARGAITASKLPLTLRETPQSVSVITRQQIEDRNFMTIDDAVESATGITGTAANLGSITFNARGFSMGSTQIDGMMGAGTSTGGYTPNVAMFDRVEIVRGAAGLVSGQGNPGGVVNLVRKRPLETERYGLVAHAGTWNQFRVEADISVPLTDWLRVRGIAAYEDREFFIDLQHAKRPLLYGILEADVTPTTLVTIGASYEENNTDAFFNSGLPWFSDGRDSRLPRSSRGIAPGWNHFNVNAVNAFGGIEQQLGGSWKAKLQVNYQHWLQDWLAPNAAVVAAIDPVTLIGPRLGATITDIMSSTETVSAEGQVSGEVNLLGRAHEVMVGASHSRQLAYGRKEARATVVAVPQPIFGADPWAIAEPTFGPFVPIGNYTRTVQQGIWGVARLNVADPLKLIVGARLSNHETVSRANATATPVSRKQKNVFTPYGGIVFDVDRNWSLYASYADIFRVQNSLYQADGTPLPPVVGANYELGAKGEFYDGKLNLSFALFRILETNRSQIDPENPLPCAGSPTGGACYIAEGKVRGQGLETEISGELIPGLQITAGYTYTKTRYLRDRLANGTPSANQGRQFSMITPKHLVRIWANYALPGTLEGVTLGAGINAQSRTTSAYNVTDIVEQAGYVLVNARLGYRVNEHLMLGLNANNLFDKRYYQRLGAWSSGNRYGEPRSVLLTARLTY